ncbi:hypothetical protein M9H77_20773 [Catharanthus roseus]|uniref:Uncharacterized protein n=1 Tax=Catharanthus roseus TaxID=4058 RepID=A0ACC0AKP2_CATRO|nr:hypothetical protein M9H77_20773 [Catharanthus roseus]
MARISSNRKLLKISAVEIFSAQLLVFFYTAGIFSAQLEFCCCCLLLSAASFAGISAAVSSCFVLLFASATAAIVFRSLNSSVSLFFFFFFYVSFSLDSPFLPFSAASLALYI